MVVPAINTTTASPECESAYSATKYLATLLYLVNQLDLADPRRQVLAQKLTNLKTHSQEQAQYWEHLGDMELGCAYDHKDFGYWIVRPSQGIRVLLDGHLDDLIAEL